MMAQPVETRDRPDHGALLIVVSRCRAVLRRQSTRPRASRHGQHDSHIWAWHRARRQADHRAAERARLNKAVLAIQGTEGGAMAERPRKAVETIRAGERRVEMQDEDPLSRMTLTRLQIDVAAYARDLWRDCLPGLDLPGAMGDCGIRSGRRHMTLDEEAAAARAWLDWRRAMDWLSERAGAGHERAFKSAVLHGERANVRVVKEALDELARHWRMK